MSLLGSPFQVIQTYSDNQTLEVGVDVALQTGTSKTISLPLARNCTLENGNNIIRVIGVGHSVTVAATSPDTILNGGSVTIGSGKVGYCESNALNAWIVTGDSA